MSKKYIVNIIPYEYYFGLPTEPGITASIVETTKWFGFHIKSEQIFDTENRDLFKCVSDCNRYFEENNINPEQVQWPEFCRYIKEYKE